MQIGKFLNTKWPSVYDTRLFNANVHRFRSCIVFYLADITWPLITVNGLFVLYCTLFDFGILLNKKLYVKKYLCVRIYSYLLLCIHIYIHICTWIINSMNTVDYIVWSLKITFSFLCRHYHFYFQNNGFSSSCYIFAPGFPGENIHSWGCRA